MVSENSLAKKYMGGFQGKLFGFEKIFFSTKNVDQDLSFYWKIETMKSFNLRASNLPRLPFIYLFLSFHKGIFQPLIHSSEKKKKSYL